MRIGPLELRRLPDTAVAADAPTGDVHAKSVGASGTINIGGFLHQDDERNHELRSPEMFRTFDRMHRTDPAVREAYLHTTVPVANATWDVEPASDDPDHLEHAEMLRCAFFDWLDTPFNGVMQLALRYLRQGRQLFEVTEKVITASLEVATPDSEEDTIVPARQFVTWARFEHRRPETIWKWVTEDGVLQQVVQHAYKDGNWGNWTMDADNLLLLVNEQEGDDFDGFSIIRPAYKPWKLKEMVERVAAIAIQTHGAGIRVAYVPSEAKNDQSLIDDVEEQLETLQAGESGHIIFPGPKQVAASVTGTPSDGYLLEVLAPPGGLPDFTPFLDYLRADIKGAVLARFSELGHGRTGSRATSDSQSEVWYDALHAVAGYVSDAWQPSIKRLIDKNYAGVDRYPRLVARDIETKSLAEFAQANSQLVAAGAINLDRSYRAYVRQGIDAPDEDEPDENDLDQQTEPEGDLPPAPPPPGPGDVLPKV